MKFLQNKDYSIRAESGVVIRVTGMRGYEVQLETMRLSVPIDYSGDDIGPVWATSSARPTRTIFSTSIAGQS